MNRVLESFGWITASGKITLLCPDCPLHRDDEVTWIPWDPHTNHVPHLNNTSKNQEDIVLPKHIWGIHRTIPAWVNIWTQDHHMVLHEISKEIWPEWLQVQESMAIHTASSQEGMYEAQKLDGIAWIKLLYRLKNNLLFNFYEEDISLLIETFRNVHDAYRGPSFSTIVGFGVNSARIHYVPQKNQSARIIDTGSLLIDSGGQYESGTTDTTRTLWISNDTVPEAFKRDYTLVLKGHIALASCVFPEGIYLDQLDCLARQFLWKQHDDYAHATGHGVGPGLSVHWHPRCLSWQWRKGTPIKEGMIISNEPGCYRENQWGIRLENVQCVHSHQKGWLSFFPLTCVPFDLSLMDMNLMTSEEILWVHTYHQKIYHLYTSSIYGKHLSHEEKIWLKTYIDQ
jgi:Xaa-Pro aminopeptidase